MLKNPTISVFLPGLLWGGGYGNYIELFCVSLSHVSATCSKEKFRFFLEQEQIGSV